MWERVDTQCLWNFHPWVTSKAVTERKAVSEPCVYTRVTSKAERDAKIQAKYIVEFHIPSPECECVSVHAGHKQSCHGMQRYNVDTSICAFEPLEVTNKLSYEVTHPSSLKSERLTHLRDKETRMYNHTHFESHTNTTARKSWSQLQESNLLLHFLSQKEREREWRTNHMC